MAVNYTEKGLGLWDSLAAAGLKLHNHDGVFYTNPANFADTSKDAEVQAFINAYDPLPYIKKQRIAQIRDEGVARARSEFPAISNFDELDLLSQTMQSIAPAARQLTARITKISNIWIAGQNAAASVNAATKASQVAAVTPAWPA